MQPPILITGAARSGISIIAAVLNRCGAWGGIPGCVDYDGRKCTENEDVDRLVMRPALNGLRADAVGQAPLPSTRSCENVADDLAPAWRRRIERIVTSQGCPEGPWFYASPRICLLWPIWRKAFPDSPWILVRRNDDDIIRACLRTKYMTAYKDYPGWSVWLDAYKRKFEEMISVGLDIRQIWPQRAINGQLHDLEQLVKALGLEWDAERLSDFLAPILWKKGLFSLDMGGVNGN